MNILEARAIAFKRSQEFSAALYALCRDYLDRVTAETDAALGGSAVLTALIARVGNVAKHCNMHERFLLARVREAYRKAPAPSSTPVGEA